MPKVYVSSVIGAPAADVWAVIRNFNGLPSWTSFVADSRIEQNAPADQIGCIRNFTLKDGGRIREKLLALSDYDLSCSYAILESPMGVENYVATLSLTPVTDGNATFWEWRSSFNPPAHRRDELVGLVAEGIYQAGFAAVRRMLGGKPTPARALSRERPPVAPVVAPPRVEVIPAAVPGSDTKAVVVERHGGPEVLQLRDVALPPLAPEEVRIRHSVIGVNFIDVYCRTGYFDLLQPPGVPGMEAAGVIEAVGTGVSGFAPGDRVAYACPPVGAYCERRNMRPDLLVHLSDDIADDIAAASLLKGVTASFLLHDVHAVRAGSVVLIHAAAGGIGQLLVQWARHLGATVIATVSSDDKARVVERLGAHHVVVYSREDFTDAVMRLTGGAGADVIYDAVGKDTFAGSLAALAVRGHLVSFGQASGPVGSHDIGRMASRSATISRPNYGHYTDTPEKLAPHVTRFFGALRQGVLRVESPTRYELARAADAHRDLEARRTTGALVLMP